MLGVLALLTVVTMQPIAVSSQLQGALQPGFGQAIPAVHRAELAGATSSEVSGLVTQLNKALELNREALMLTGPQDGQARAALLAQTDQILSTVTEQANELANTSQQRAQTNQMLSYAGGFAAAVIGTLLYIFLVSLHQRYRTKRMFEMKVTPK